MHDTHALVIEGNAQSRAILVSQLRELGVGTVSQCSRLEEARLRLETNRYDIVICEQVFEKEPGTGQDLLDDLRRNQLLPFFTVFIMVTAEASYYRVAEAAESALDAYLLKPHTAARLAERILHARERKSALHDIFAAIDHQDFAKAASLCLKRFESRQDYWLYAARVGAELMLRNGQIAEAQALYEAVAEARNLPWSRLGVARAQMEAGRTHRAILTLEQLVSDEPSYADAYDVMGRAHFELGNFDQALSTFRQATQLIPGSISRLGRHGMLAWYAGDREEGTLLLESATRLGLPSKMYDPQALVLLAFSRLDANDHRGLVRIMEQLNHLIERAAARERPQRLLELVRSIDALQQRQIPRVLEDIGYLSRGILTPEFDFEMATNLLTLLGRADAREVFVPQAHSFVTRIGMRFCASRAQGELLAMSTGGHEAYRDLLRQCHARVNAFSEQAMALTIQGHPQATVVQLMDEGENTRNARLIELSHQVLLRHADSIADHQALLERVRALRQTWRTQVTNIRLGEGAQGARAGGVALSPGYRPPRRDGILDRMRTD